LPLKKKQAPGYLPAGPYFADKNNRHTNKVNLPTLYVIKTLIIYFTPDMQQSLGTGSGIESFSQQRADGAWKPGLT